MIKKLDNSYINDLLVVLGDDWSEEEWKNGEFGKKSHINWLKKELNNPTLDFWGYFKDKNLIAYSLVTSYDENIFLINPILVMKKHQQKGVGSNFFKFLISNYKGQNKLMSFAQKDNMASIRLHEKHNFKKLKTIPKPLQESKTTPNDLDIHYLYALELEGINL